MHSRRLGKASLRRGDHLKKNLLGGAGGGGHCRGPEVEMS